MGDASLREEVSDNSVTAPFLGDSKYRYDS